MLTRLVERFTRSGRIALLLGAAVVVGALLGVALGASSPVRISTVGDSSTATAEDSATPTSASPTKADSRERKATKTAKPEKAQARADRRKTRDEANDANEATEADEGDDGVHGACVSKVAEKTSKVGGPHHNHGWVVSRAAHRCPHETASD